MSSQIERFDPSMRGRIAYEHLHRYAMAREFVSGARVLDVACGEGYGAWILSRAAAEVVGVDIDADTIAAAARKYVDAGRLSFRTGDCHKLPFPDASFDAVVSFETIEHVADLDRTLREFRRVLRPGGFLLASTPNKAVYNRFKEPNAFHVREFDRSDFVTFLQATFANVRLFGQRLAVVSTMTSEDDRGTVNSSSYAGFVATSVRGSLELNPGTVRLKDPEYAVALCGDGDLPWPSEAASIYLDRDDDLWAAQERTLHWASGVHNELEAAHAHAAAERKTFEGALEDGRRLHEETRQQADRIATELNVTRGERDTARDEARKAADLKASAGQMIGDAVGAASRNAADVTLTRLLSQLLDRPVTGDVAELAAALSELAARQTARQAETNALRLDLDRLTRLIERFSGLANAGTIGPEALMFEIGSRLDQLARRQAEYESSRALLSDEQAAATALRDRLAAAETETNSLRSALDRVTGLIARVSGTETAAADAPEALMFEIGNRLDQLARRQSEHESSSALLNEEKIAAAALRERLAASDAETGALRGDLDRLTRLIERFSGTEMSGTVAPDALMFEIGSRLDQFARQQSDYETSRTLLSEEKTAAAALRERLAASDAETNALRLNLDRLTRTIAEQKSEHDARNALLSDEKITAAALRDRLAASDFEANALRLDLDRLTRTIEEQKSEHDAQNALLHEEKTAAAALRDRLAAVEADAAHMAIADGAEIERLTAALADATAADKAAAAQSRQRLTKLEADLALAHDERDALQSRVARLDDELHKVAALSQSEADLRDGRSAALQARIGALEADLARAISHTQERAAESGQLREKLAWLEQALTTAQRESSSVISALTAREAQVRDSSEQAKAAQQRADEIEARYASLSESSEALQRSWDDARGAADGERTSFVRQIKAQADDLRRIEGELASSRTTAAGASGELERARAASQGILNDNRQLRSRVDMLIRSARNDMRQLERGVQDHDRTAEEQDARDHTLSEQVGSAIPHLSPLPPHGPAKTSWFKRAPPTYLGYELSDLVTRGDEANRARDWAGAESFYAGALRMQSDLPEIWVQYGHMLKEQAKFERAESAYRQAVLRAPHMADAHLQLGVALSLLNRTAAAKRSFAEATRLQPDLQTDVDNLIGRLGPEFSLAAWRDGLDGLRQRLAAFETGKQGGEASPVSIGADAVGTLSESDLRDIWPPPSLDDYWLTQAMRDYILDMHGQDVVDLYQYLMSVVEAYTKAPSTFPSSSDAHILLSRASHLAAKLDSPAPDVSIVMTAYNNVFLTLTSIVAVLETAGRYSFEILVGDDVSQDATATLIGAIKGCVHHIRHPENLGFLNNCNAVALRARGRFIVMLNNDTLALPRWLDELIAPLDRDPAIGLSGSKLLNGDGTLQEAGGVFWQDGSAWNFGRNADPRLPEFNYLKDTDYVSGASIALRTEIWHAMGGFDPLFVPGYCEDSDLAFRLRAAGHKTVFAPQSEIIHHEGRTHGTDTSSGMKAYQVTNGHKFVARWDAVLKRDHFPNAENVFLARDRSRYKPHILVIDHYVPQWDQDAGSRTLYLYIKLFVDSGFMVTFWPDNLYRDPNYAFELQNMGVEVIYSDAYHERFPQWVSENGRHFDYAFLSRPDVTAKYIADLKRHSACKVLFYGHDLHFKRLRHQYEVDQDPDLLERASRYEQMEIDICKMSDVVFYPGFEEIAFLRERLPARIVLKTFPVTVFKDERLAQTRSLLNTRTRSNPHHLMFIGGFRHTPNVDGVVWFAREVMPELSRRDPRFHLFIAGSHVPAEVEALASDAVTILGRISDESLEELYARVGVAVVPLRYGAGVKGKVIEAMAYGAPVVMTTVGSQGIPGADTMAVVADSPEDFANGIIDLVDDPGGANERARNALAFIDRSYSEQGIREVMASVVPELAPTRRLS